MTTTIHRHRLLGDHAWQARAACRPRRHHDVDPEQFFPEHHETSKIAAAKALCGQCPVQRTCLDAALETRDTEGIRGGLTEEERAPLHENLQHRLDYSRVNDAIAGRDIHLTKAERKAVVTAVYRDGLGEERLAAVLKISVEHAQKQLRRMARADRNGTLQAQPPSASSTADIHFTTLGAVA
ncbi:WhiB family transcriptional regulator [Streptacidiphilus sp. PB12-B1b]|uniref:WhiB family transcriptional regulator n=1 Tax=Streptacidiphilus sp. PB12-B1b TaxID=2705012 RepID=UPI0015F93A49|nr:WhiB family transcriptional regulator [Streptacidiphilus sp. PB12-B1b]QMU79045.1 WhiB family transcriptional regulator [Streptacidiphilus sp. PB12-B1b]